MDVQMSDSLFDGMAGAAGAVVATLLTYPISTLSTFQSVRKKQHPDIPSSSQFWDAVYQLTAVDGWMRLYDGLQPTLVGAATSQGIYFYFYSLLRKKAKVQFKEWKTTSLSFPESCLIGYLAGCINVVLTNPIYVIATRIQAHRRGDQSFWKAVREACTIDGLEWMYKGVFPALILAVNPAIQHAIYDVLKRTMQSKKKKTESSKNGETIATSEVCWMMAVSKLGATLLTYPLLTVQARLQIGRSGSRQNYRNIWDAISTIYEEEGLTGFYNGVSARCLHSVLTAAITMSVKEKVTNTLLLFKKQKQQSDLKTE